MTPNIARHYPSPRVARSPLHRPRCTCTPTCPSCRRPAACATSSTTISGHPMPSPALFKPLPRSLRRGGQGVCARRSAFPLVPFERGAAQRRRRRRLPRALHRAARASSSSASRKRRCGPSKRTSDRARGRQRHASTSRASRSPSITTTSTSTIRDWGPAFLKIGTYLPVSRQALSQRPRVGEAAASGAIAFALRASTMGFSPVPIPPRLQAACDALGPADVQAFFDRWSQRLPWPMTAGRPRGRLRPSPRHLPARSQSHPGLRPAGAGPALLRSRHPRESRPRAARPRAACSFRSASRARRRRPPSAIARA